MTNQQQDIPLPVAVPGEAMATVAAASPVRYTKVHAETIKEIAQDTWARLMYLPQTVGFRRPGRRERYLMYLTKPWAYMDALQITWETAFPGMPMDLNVLMPLIDSGQAKAWFSWEEQFATWPDQAQKAWDDFQELRLAAEAGEFDE